MPVKVNVTNNSGDTNSYTPEEFNETGLNINQLDSSTSNTLYYNGESNGIKKYSLTPTGLSNSKVSVKLNKNTGKITVNAPIQVANLDYYKEQIVPKLETLSADYKDNPDTKYIDEETDEEKSIEDEIKTFEESLNNDILPYATQLIQSKNQIKSTYGFDDISDSDAVIMNTKATRYYDSEGNIQNPSDTSVQALPANLIKRYLGVDVTGLDSYSEDTHSATKADVIDKIWTRVDQDEEDLWELYGAVKELAYDKNADSTERAEAIAFLEFMQDQKPETTFWNGVGDFFEGAFSLVTKGGGQLGANLLGFGEQLVSGVTAAVYDWFQDDEHKISGHDLASQITKNVLGDPTGQYTGEEGDKAFFAEYLNDIIEDHLNEYDEKQAIMSPIEGTVSTLADIGFTVMESIAIAKLVEGAVAGAATKVASAGSKVATMATELTKAAETGVFTEKTLSGLSALNKGAQVLVSVLGSQKTISVLNGLTAMASAVAPVVNGVAQFSTTASFVTKPLELLIESITEAVITRPDLTRKLLSDSATSDETRDAVLQELGWNIAGWGMGLGIGKALSKFSESTVGGALSRNLSIFNSKISGKIGNLKTAIRVKLTHGADSALDVVKLMERKAAQKGGTKWKAYLDRLLSREIKNVRGNMDYISIVGKDTDEIADAIKAYDETLAEGLMKFENSLDDYFQGSTISLKKFVSESADVNASEEYKAYNDAMSNVIKAENNVMQSGNVFFTLEGKNKLGKSASEIRIFTQGTSNYIGASRILNYLDTWQRVTGKSLSEAQQATYAAAEKMYLDFIENASPELLNAVDDYIVKYKVLNHKLTDVYMNYGIENSSYIKELRNSGMFGADGMDYYRVQRKVEIDNMKEWTPYWQTQGDTLLKQEEQHLADFATGDFIDPNIVLEQSMYEHAQFMTRKNLVESFGIATKTDGEIIVSAEESEYVRKMNTAWEKNLDGGRSKSLKQVYKESTNSFVEELTNNLAQGKTLDDFYALKELNNSIITAEDNAVDAGAKISRAKAKQYIGNASNRLEAIASFDTDEITDFARTYNGASYSDIVKADGKTAYGALTKGEGEGSEFYYELARTYDEGLEEGAEQTFKDLTLDEQYNYTKKYLSENPDLTEQMDRSALRTNKTFKESEDVRNKVQQILSDRNIQKAETIYAERLKNLQNWYEMIGYGEVFANAKGEIINDVNKVIDSLIDDMKNKRDIDTVFQAIADKFGVEKTDEFMEYMALKALYGNSDDVSKAVSEAFRKQYKNLAKGLSKEDQKYLSKLYNEYTQLVEDEIASRYNDLRLAMMEINADLVDTSEYFSDISKIQKEITKQKNVQDVILTTNEKGQAEWVKVNPLLAELVSVKTANQQMSELSKLLYLENRLFRMGTTGPLALKSMVSQFFKDDINAFTSGMTQVFTDSVVKNMTKEFGDTVVDYLKMASPETYEQLLKQAGGNMDELAELAVRRELNAADDIINASTRTAAESLSKDYGYSKYVNGKEKKTLLDKAIKKLDDALESDKWWNPDNINEFRETTLRRQIYQNNFYRALKNGASIEDARAIATMFMSNGTTNFTRKIVFFNRFASTTPYLAAAVNGTRSFWKLASIDPIGVFSRLFMGVGMPVMAMTMLSLGDEKSRAIYKNIPEYQKDGNLVFVINGNIMTIPIPEQFSAIVNPMRQLIENMYGVNRHSFADLLTNDIMQLSPINIDGFYNIDAVDLLNDDTWYNRFSIERGLSKLFSQIAPPVAKAAAIGFTGVDPYTGNKVNRTYKEYDPETGDFVTMNDYSGQFAKALAEITNGSVSAPMAEAIIEGLLGSGSIEVLNELTNLVNLAIGNETVGTKVPLLEGMTEQLLAPLAAYSTSQAQKGWNSAISELYDIKENLINSKKYQSAIKNLNSATSEEARTKAMAALNNLIDPFYKQALSAVQNLNSVFGAEFDSTKFASVVSLLNMGSTITVGATNESAYNYISSLTSDLKTEGKAEAIATMNKLGFPSASGTDIFGKAVYNSTTGETYISYTLPLAILNAKNSIWSSNDLHLANIQALLSGGSEDLTDYDVKTNFVNSYVSAGHTKKEAYTAWNKKVLERIDQYVSKYGFNEAITSAVSDYLDNYMYVGTYSAKSAIKKLYDKLEEGE